MTTGTFCLIPLEAGVLQWFVIDDKSAKLRRCVPGAAVFSAVFAVILTVFSIGLSGGSISACHRRS
jgi:hypothetical protein